MRDLLRFTLIILLLSFGITANAGAQNLVARFVAGRYWVSGRTAGSNQRMLRVVNFLIAKAHRARRASR